MGLSLGTLDALTPDAFSLNECIHKDNGIVIRAAILALRQALVCQEVLLCG